VPIGDIKATSFAAGPVKIVASITLLCITFILSIVLLHKFGKRKIPNYTIGTSTFSCPFCSGELARLKELKNSCS
jgi:hypothetical protein